MSDVRGVGGVQPTDTASTKIRRVQLPAQTEPITDKVEIAAHAARASEVARVADLAKASPDIRTDVVERAKQRLESGEYLSDAVTRSVAEKIAESL
jgi:anti-sigma28 factor (negative regulator of flagellin synthesis)